MRNTLILLVLLSLGLSTTALANGHQRKERYAAERNRVEQAYRHTTHHDRGTRYPHFQKKMQRLRQALRQERRINRRLNQRRNWRQERRFERRVVRHADRQPFTTAAYRPLRPLLFPRLILRIPLNW